MNCQEFESRFELLGRDAPADARTRDAAAAHEESCAGCAARVADERALSTGLRALAAGMKGAQAPARAEAALLAAFRARAASEAGAGPGAAAGATCNVVPLADHPRARRWSWVRTAAAATLAAAASVALFVLVRPGAGVDQSAMIEPPPGALVPSTKSGVAQVSPKRVDETAPQSLQSFTPAAQRSQRAPSAAPRARAVNASYNAGARPAALERPARDVRPQEIATEFIPLTQGAQYAQSEEGHLVRVELPRSALASFGLSVNFEAASGRVKADVLLGEDGTARAIRFVR